MTDEIKMTCGADLLDPMFKSLTLPKYRVTVGVNSAD